MDHPGDYLHPGSHRRFHPAIYPALIRSMLKHSQNFIENPRLVSGLLDMTDINREDLVLEIGPGTGAITGQLAQRARQVTAIEQDSRLARSLAQKMALSHANVQVVTANFLDFRLPNDRYKVVANIPFNLTADIIRKLFMGREVPPQSAYLIMQEEAAGKFIGEPKATLMSTLLGIYYEVSSLSRISRRAFVPTPRVDASFVAFLKKGEPAVDDRDVRDFQDFITYGYVHSQRGKPILDSFHDILTARQRSIIEREIRLSQLGVGELNIIHWVNLFETFNRLVPNDRKAVIRGSFAKLVHEQARLPKEHRTRRY